jgi:type-F conjugative transfer system mating-pair stabilization protein TraN
MRRLPVFLVLLYGCSLASDMSKARQEVAEITGKIGKYLPQDVGDIPGYVGTDIPETTYDDRTMELAKFDVAAKDETFQMIQESVAYRPKYDIDPETDPMFVQSNQILEDLPHEAASQEAPKTSLHKCIRGRSVYESRCHIKMVPVLSGKRKELKTIQVQVPKPVFNKLGGSLFLDLYATASCQCITSLKKPALSNTSQLNSVVSAIAAYVPDVSPESVRSIRIVGHNNHCDRMYGMFGNTPSWYVPATHYVLEVIYEEEIDSYELKSESGCESLEDRVDQNRCSLVSRKCVDSGQTRIINGQALTADCWKEELTYRCYGEETNTCQDLLGKGCTQLGSVCKTRDQDECIEWEQTFECYDDEQFLSRPRLKWDQAPCLDGSCVNQTWEPNRDMADSLSKLAIFKEMQKDMDPDTQAIFKGTPYKCSRIPASFKNCCVRKSKGWGMKIGLAHCTEEEKQLAEQRSLNKCIRIGTYCAEKHMGACTKKKTSFCCYQSKLARIINEQAAGQLGLGFGDPKHPKCAVLTLSDFQKIDFEKINFSELFEDILSKTRVPDMSAVTKSIQRSMEDKSRLITDKSRHITQGRSNAGF